MDGLGQLFIAQNGSVYALVPAQSREPPPRPARALPSESEVTTALLAQYLQRQQQQQQQQQHEQHVQQQHLALQLDGLAVPNSVQREDGLHNLLQATLMQSYPAPVPPNHNAHAGPSTSSHLGASVPPPVQRRRMPSVESPSNSGRSESQSPPPSGRERSERSNQNGLGVTAQASAKEKNRQAQRRFRERQKDLIANLKQRVEDLQNKVVESEKEIIALKEENAMLRGRIEGKQQGSSVTLPAETLQSLLQMTGAGGLLGADAPKPPKGTVGGSSGGGQGYRVGRGPGNDLVGRNLDACRHGSGTGQRGDFGGRGGQVE